MSTRKALRALRRMGLKVEPMQGVEEVVFKVGGRELVVEDPQVFVVEMRGQRFFQVLGRLSERKAEIEIPEEDIMLVAQQAGVSREEAEEALRKTGGDLAKAIILLTGGGA